MSVKHPIISITGSSGAGTTSVKKDVREHLPPRKGIRGLYRGRRLPPLQPRRDATKMAEEGEQAATANFSHFSPETNLFEELERCSANTANRAPARTRHYVHDADEAKLYGAEPGTFTQWGPLPKDTDLLFYEGLHGAVVTDRSTSRNMPISRSALCRSSIWNGSRNCTATERPRLHPGGGGRHHPAAHAGLREFHLSAIHRDRHQFPARADRRYRRIRSSRDGSRRRTNRWW